MQTKLSDEMAAKLIKEYGSPLYVFDKAGFENDYKNLLAAFRKYYPKYKIAYSYKTNYTPKVCELVKALGGYAEVVSGMEYTLAKHLGYENEKIMYNGPVKGKEMYEHIALGGTVNIDNLNEFSRVVDYALSHSDQGKNKAYRCWRFDTLR